jgi:hypothetical protein
MSCTTTSWWRWTFRCAPQPPGISPLAACVSSRPSLCFAGAPAASQRPSVRHVRASTWVHAAKLMERGVAAVSDIKQLQKRRPEGNTKNDRNPYVRSFKHAGSCEPLSFPHGAQCTYAHTRTHRFAVLSEPLSPDSQPVLVCPLRRRRRRTLTTTGSRTWSTCASRRTAWRPCTASSSSWASTTPSR